MQIKSLVEAKIVPVYRISSPTFRKNIVIFLPTKTIYLFPAKGGLKMVGNRKYSLRRLMRWALKGCKVNIQGTTPISRIYPIVYLTEDNLDRMMSGVKEKDRLIKEIYETFNT